MMVKNDYRRSLIMFRSHAQGYSGHVRLERRTLMGSMFFVVNAPGGTGTLCATLVCRDARGAYFAAKLGELRRDGADRRRWPIPSTRATSTATRWTTIC